MRYGVWCLLMTLAMCAPSTTVGAQDADRAPTTAAHDAEARSLFEAGRLAFADARYADALAYFRRSFVLSSPVFRRRVLRERYLTLPNIVHGDRDLKPRTV